MVRVRSWQGYCIIKIAHVWRLDLLGILGVDAAVVVDVGERLRRETAIAAEVVEVACAVHELLLREEGLEGEVGVCGQGGLAG